MGRGLNKQWAVWEDNLGRKKKVVLKVPANPKQEENVKTDINKEIDVEKICNQINNGTAELRDVAFIGTVIKDFTQTASYKILKRTNENQIKNFLTGGRLGGESSEFRLGQMEGIQMGFENQVTALINLGIDAYEKQMEEGKEDEENE